MKCKNCANEIIPDFKTGNIQFYSHILTQNIICLDENLNLVKTEQGGIQLGEPIDEGVISI